MTDMLHDTPITAPEDQGYALWETMVETHSDQMDSDAMLTLFFHQFTQNMDLENVMDVLTQHPELYLTGVGLFDAMIGYFKHHKEELPKNVDVKQYLAQQIIAITPEDSMPEYLEPMLALAEGEAPGEDAFLKSQEIPSFTAVEYMGEAEPAPSVPLDDYVPSEN